MVTSLPLGAEIGGVFFPFRNRCDFATVLDAIAALNDSELSEEERLRCALFIFYEDLSGCADLATAAEVMLRVAGCSDVCAVPAVGGAPLMSWEKDFDLIVPAVNRVLCREVRDCSVYTHWYTFVGAYLEIGDCMFANVVSVRKKLRDGVKPDASDLRFIADFPDLVRLPDSLSPDDSRWLDG